MFYKYYTTDLKKKNIYSWNDGTYFAKLEFIDTLFSLNLPKDVWNIEIFLKKKFDNNKYIRWGCNKYYFNAANIHGRNINKKLSLNENLKRFFGELHNWNRIPIIISAYY